MKSAMYSGVLSPRMANASSGARKSVTSVAMNPLPSTKASSSSSSMIGVYPA